MRSEIWKSPLPGSVRGFATQNLADVRYVIANKTPFLIYVTDQAVLSVDAAAAVQITSVDPMATKVIGAVNANNLTVATAGDIRVAFGSNTGTFIAVTTVAPNESITDIESSSAWANYNASAEDSLLAATPIVALQPGLVNQQIFGPHDISQWTGFYFGWNTTNTSIGLGNPAFAVVVAEFSNDGTNFFPSRVVEGRGGFIAVPKVAQWFRIRFIGVNSIQTDTASYNYGVSLRRVATPLDPVVSLLEDTMPFIFQDILPAVTLRNYFLPNNNGKNKIAVALTGQAAASVYRIGIDGSGIVDTVIQHRDAMTQRYEYDGAASDNTTTTVTVTTDANARACLFYYWAIGRVDV